MSTDRSTPSITPVRMQEDRLEKVIWMAMWSSVRGTAGDSTCKSASDLKIPLSPSPAVPSESKGIRCKSRCRRTSSSPVYLVYSVYLVCLVHLVSCVQPNTRDRPNRPDRPLFNILLRRSIGSFRSDPIRRERRGINILQCEIGVPDELPLKPLASRPLISHLKPYLVQIPLHLLDPPFTQPGDAIAFAHRAHMLSHRLKNCGVPDCLMGLHHRKGLSGPTIHHRLQRRRLHPEIVDRAQEEHCHGRIVDDLHS